MSVAEELRRLGGLLTGARRDRIHARASLPEVPDPIPLELPVGYEQPPSMQELVQQYVRETLSDDAAASDMGTFEEEDDFEVDDENLLDLSGYEVHEFEMVEENPVEDPAPPEDPPVAAPAAPETEPPVVDPPE